ncbi:restriction endonuclease subunit S [Tenacibaculum finnmarkense]|uniref:restriction endonuclease subunit S n=1 Tax=Tenacibaculum finnmarkense TaxID=2781243 RepID=UPI000C7CB0D1|nr:restriction endonuclease subunit S [Tenacibaculum finnmarkense]
MSPLNKKLNNVKWGEFRVGDLFDINNTLSFNKDSLVIGNDYDYVTRTSQNQGVLQETGFVNNTNINPSGNWSLGLMQMDFFHRERAWYAGQFVRKITPKIELNKSFIKFLTVALNKLKPKLLTILVRNIDTEFLNSKIQLPTKNGKIDFDFMENFINDLETERIAKLDAYLVENGLHDYELSAKEKQVLLDFEKDKIKFGEFTYQNIFNNIKQGRRLKKDDQILGDIPFVMAGVTDTGIVNHISNPVATFPKNSITIDIFGNTFYRNYDYGAGDDTGVYWNDKTEFSKETMLFFASSMEKSIFGKFDYGNKLRSSKSLNFKMKLPIKSKKPDYKIMETLISAIQKTVVKDVVLYVKNKGNY